MEGEVAKTIEWWQSATVRPELESCLAKINEVQDFTDPVTAFSLFSQALNVLWSGKRRIDNDRGRSDNQSIRDVLLSMPASRQEELCDASDVRVLADLVPQILNVDFLRASEHFVPNSAIPHRLEKGASSEHREFANALQRWRDERKEQSCSQTLKKLATLLYVVRSNIAHGEKTTKGPDLAKAARDTQVCDAALPAIRTVMNSVLNYPTQKLIAYGSLKPSEPNYAILEPVTDQEWLDVEVEGTLTQRKSGLKSFRWRESRTRHSAMLLKSSQLASFWPRLDAFEGVEYKRALATALVGEVAVVAMVYQDSSC